MGHDAGGPEFLLGRTIDEFRIERIIGTGSTSIVYGARRANEEASGPPDAEVAAIKVLTLMQYLTKADYAMNYERFVREARVMQGLKHPHIVPVWGFGEVDGVAYTVLPRLEGGSLAERITALTGTLLLPFAIDVLAQVASALDYAHAHGVVHRDVKPSNVLFDLHDHAYLADFGIAVLLSQAGNPASTGTGQILATPYYMAPEQIKGEPVGAATDIYALTVMLYLMVTGQVPFQGDTPLSVAMQHLQDEPCPPSVLCPNLPAAIDKVVLRGLAKRPEDRFQSAAALVEAFATAAISTSPGPARDAAGPDKPDEPMMAQRALAERDSLSTSPTTSEAEPTRPDTQRQVALQSAHQRNVSANKPPYWRVAITSREELLWIMEHHDWSGEVYAEGKERPDLSGADLHDVDLRHVVLNGAKLRGANLRGADLRSARLEKADLTEADLRRANASGAKLRRATLVGASLERTTLTRTYLNRCNLADATLHEADLTSADLEAATLVGADLSDAVIRGARLHGVRMDTATQLTGVVLDDKTQLGDVVWNGAPLTRVDWSRAPRLGDELALRATDERGERARRAHDAARAYRDLALALHAQGLALDASRYRLREQQLHRLALRLERRYGAWLFSWLLNVVAGHGERPERTVVAYLTVILSFATMYFGVARIERFGAGFGFMDALIFSVTSFHGRGFFPGTLPPLTHPLAAIAAAEAIVGLFIELVFIASFTRRFLGA